MGNPNGRTTGLQKGRLADPCASNPHLFLHPIMAQALGLASMQMLSAMNGTTTGHLFRLVLFVTKQHEVLVTSAEAASKVPAGMERTKYQCGSFLAAGKKQKKQML